MNISTTNFAFSLLVSTGFFAASTFVQARAMDVYPFQPDSSCREFGQQELDQVLESAIGVQASFRALEGEFEATFSENLAAISAEALRANPELTYNKGQMTATMNWWRNEDSDRLDVKYDMKSQELMQNLYEDVVLFQDSEKQVKFLPRTRQAVFVRRNLFRLRTPDTWLIPGHPSGFQAFRRNDQFRVSGFQLPSGESMIRIFRESENPLVVRLSLDFSVTEWWSPGGLTSCTIAYSQNPNGQVYPTVAVMETFDKFQQQVRKWTLRTNSLTFGPPHKPFVFVLPPGTLVADNRRDLYGGKVQSFEALADGAIKPITSISFGGRSASALPTPRHLSIGGGALAGVFMVMMFRFYKGRPV